MNYSSYIALIPLLPLAGFLILGLFGRKYFRKSSGLIGCGILLISTALALYTAYQYFFVNGTLHAAAGAPGIASGAYHAIIPFKYTWLSFSHNMSIDMGILLDPISVMMLVVVTFISLMVHVFSLGYMHGEERFSTYYAFLSLFTYSMLGLVISSNIFQIYIFWELVGVSSYLLIGFYFDRPSAVAAAKKAFIVTRFADLGFLVGILVLSFYAETLDFRTLIARLTDMHSAQFTGISTAAFLGMPALTWGLILVFIGGAGKSAMFPLHVWLPDAMEGPTPVSALIHAATMVVAGVYLVARLYPVFSMDEDVMSIIAWVGASSAIIAALIACTQTDIKRVLAYSTMSQIGYMMLALGVAADTGAGSAESGLGFTASLFHLFTHAFFKSLLFLCAGSIIHAVHSNEMKDMGGLRRSMPLTHIAFLIACLAISGIPPLSGFFSKELILSAAWQSNKSIYSIALITSGITAFYMFRLYFSVFWHRDPTARPAAHPATHRAAHSAPGDGPASMRFPLIILAIGAGLAGLVPFSHYITADGFPAENHLHIGFSIVPVTVAILGIALAYSLYHRQSDRPKKITDSLGGIYRLVYGKFYIDEAYRFITKKIIFNCIGRPAAWIDRHIIDGAMNAIAAVTAAISGYIKGFQSGKVQQYALYFFAGILGLAVLFIYILK